MVLARSSTSSGLQSRPSFSVQHMLRQRPSLCCNHRPSVGVRQLHIKAGRAVFVRAALPRPRLKLSHLLLLLGRNPFGKCTLFWRPKSLISWSYCSRPPQHSPAIVSCTSGTRARALSSTSTPLYGRIKPKNSSLCFTLYGGNVAGLVITAGSSVTATGRGEPLSNLRLLLVWTKILLIFA